MSDANIAVNFDFSAMLQAHIESGADVTVAYQEEELRRRLCGILDAMKEDCFYHTFALDGDRVKKHLCETPKECVSQKFRMNIYVVRERASDRSDQLRFASRICDTLSAICCLRTAG